MLQPGRNTPELTPGVALNDPWPDLVPMLRQHLRRQESGYGIRHRQLKGNGLTPWGTYRQALHELDNRRNDLREIAWRRAELRLDYESARPRWWKPWAQRRARIRVERLQYSLERLDRAERECRRIMDVQYAVACEMLDVLGGMDSLTPERVEACEAEFLAAKTRRALAAERVAGELGVSRGVIELAWNLAGPERESVLADIKNPDVNLVTQEERRWLDAAHTVEPRIPTETGVDF